MRGLEALGDSGSFWGDVVEGLTPSGDGRWQVFALWVQGQ